MMRFWVGAPLILTLLVGGAKAAGKAEVLEVRKIWDAGRHNAFTDLVRWHDRWWCTFREADAHVGGDGKIRVIVSSDGQKWESAALVEEKGIDLRDPKFSVTPDDRLMIVAGGSVYGGTTKLQGRQPRVMFSADGKTWTAPVRVMSEGDWLWRVTWHDGKAYGTSYNTITPGNSTAKGTPTPAAPEWDLKLYSSADGVKWELVTALEVTDRPNETTLRFNKKGEMLALVRREAGNRKAWLGVSKPPFKQWAWHELNYQIGGPNFIELPDGTMAASGRNYITKPGATTFVGPLTLERVEPLITLPSGGDTSYPGLVWENGVLWVSYYASHEGKSSIYLAKIKWPLN